jgi:hypothetical protein
MTAAEWDAGTDPERMLTAAESRLSDRKLLLVGCGCARLAWDRLPEWALTVVPQLERIADETDPDLRTAAMREAVATTAGTGTLIGLAFLLFQPQVTVRFLLRPVLQLLRNLPPNAGDLSVGPSPFRDAAAAGVAQAAVLRCVAGNPFRKVRFRPEWLTTDVRALAAGADAEGDFERLPILADALQDAGCTEKHVLGHLLADNSAHARGCWVLDRILGKE